jgi:hypothetical protein
MSPAFVPPTRESVYAALFALLQQSKINGQPAFVTTGRAVQSPEQINGIEKPAMFMLQTDEEWKQNNSGLPFVADAQVEVYIFVQQPDDLVAPAPQLNNLVDASLAAIAPSLPTYKQTLGGLVENVVLRGKCEYRMGFKGTLNAFAVYTLTMIMPKWQQGIP